MGKLQRLLEAAGRRAFSYSGRGMFGRQCLATELGEGESAMDLAADLFQAMAEWGDDPVDDLQEIADELRGGSRDSMGRGAVVYWPQVRFEAPAREEDEEADVPGTLAYDRATHARAS